MKEISSSDEEVLLYDSADTTDFIVEKRSSKISSVINKNNSYDRSIILL